MINLKLTKKQYRRLLDMVYVGNWILNSLRDEDRLDDYDEIEEILFKGCRSISGLESLADIFGRPSVEYCSGGIHEAIMDYEDATFYGILAEELALRDIEREYDNSDEEAKNLADRIDEYIDEFEENGIDNITVEK